MRREKESPEWIARLMASQKNEFYYKGYQRLRKSEFSNSYRPQENKPINYTLNEFAFWVNVNVAKWLNSRVDYRVHGISDNEDAESSAQKLLRIGQHYDDRDWTRSEVIRAAKAAQFEGHLVAYVYHDPTYADRKAYRPVMERRKVKLGEDAYRCAQCGSVGEYKGTDTKCAECGSDQLAVTEVPEYEQDYETGETEIKCGDVCHQLISIYNLSWKARLGLKKSDVVLWEAEHTRQELESTYEGIDIPASNVSDRGLQAKDALNSAGQQARDYKSKYVLSRMWVDPCRYKNDELKEAVKHRTGEFPSGTKLLEAFPKGFHVIMIGDAIVDLYPAVKNDDLVMMEYQSSGNGLAHGIDDMCEPQRLMNTGTSLINVWMRHSAAPPLTYVNGVVDPGDLSGDLTKPIPIEGANLALYEGVTAENAIMYRQGQVLPPQIFGYLDRLRAAIQFAASATEFSEGLPNVNNDTLGGARIAQGLAQSISSIPLAQFADFRAEIIKLKLKKFKEWCWDERYIQFAGQYGILEGEYLKNADIPETFEFETVPNSWLPRLPEQKQQNIQALLTVTQGWAGFAVMPPSLQAELCEIYDVRLNENSYPAAIRTVRMRIKQAIANLPTLAQAAQIVDSLGIPPPVKTEVDPMTGAMMQTEVTPGQVLFQMMEPPFNPREDGHAMAAEYLSRWLCTDEGMQSPPEIRDPNTGFIAALQDACIEAEVLQQQVRGSVAVAGQPPMPVEQAGSNQAPKPQPGAMAAPVGG